MCISSPRVWVWMHTCNTKTAIIINMKESLLKHTENNAGKQRVKYHTEINSEWIGKFRINEYTV